jgi:hypothetical protein
VKPRRRPHAQIHLPALNGEQAYFLADFLERALTAVCRAHGDDIADFQGRVFPDDPVPEGAVKTVDRRDTDDDDDLF